MTHDCRAFLVLVLAATGVAGFQVELGGRASGWLGFSRDSANRGTAGLRYIPRFSMSLPGSLDAELSVNGSVALDGRTIARPEVEARLKPYRATLRFSAPRFEARAGLQKVNFGSATLLRPLMWFDRVDPRDPLELTDGVYGLLARCYLQNNINVWAWGLLGNSSPKGWEVYGSERWVPEPGARVQVPVPRGEVAATYHHRAFSYEPPYLPPEPRETLYVAENRYGVDGKWDIGVGLWIEGTLSQQASDLRPNVWQRLVTVGLDYTFGLGSGPGLSVEHMMAGWSRDPFGSALGSDGHASAAMLSYPVGILDNLRGIVLYDWRGKGVYRYLAWQRTLDRWLFSVSAFWNPDTPASFGAPGGGAAGKGIQLMVVFNH